MRLKKTEVDWIRFNSLAFRVLAGIGEDQILVLIEEEGVCLEACPRLFVHEFQLAPRDLPAYPSEMVEIGIIQLF